MDILEEIQKTARQNPNRVAFHFRSGSVTYGELWERAICLACFINTQDIKKGQPIPVYGHKNLMIPVAHLACALSHHAYVPMDPGMSEMRIHDIAESVEAPFILACDSLTLSDFRVVGPRELQTITFAGSQEGALSGYVPKRDPEEIQYIIFTSGSTGRPKGVPITVGNLMSFLTWSTRLGEKVPGVFLNQAPFSFDLSVMDTWTSLVSGSTVWGVDRDLLRDSAALMEYLLKGHMTTWVSTPSFADLCLGSPDFTGEKFPELTCFLFCGETLSRRTASRLMTRFPKAKIVNTYGPTETTVCVTGVEITDSMLASDQPLPVGYPKPGTVVFAIDENGQRCPAGQTGELVIAGDTVSPGYYHNETCTREHFYEYHGVPAYRTGDLGSVDADGLVHYEARMDSQVKVHGFRIELGDIRGNLLTLPGIHEAEVVPKKVDGEIHSLAAFVVIDGNDTSYEKRKWIRTELRKRIPAYMVPKKIIFLDSIPMTMNGKADRKKMEDML